MAENQWVSLVLHPDGNPRNQCRYFSKWLVKEAHLVGPQRWAVFESSFRRKVLLDAELVAPPEAPTAPTNPEGLSGGFGAVP